MESLDQGLFKAKAVAAVIDPVAAPADEVLIGALTRCRGRLVCAANGLIRRLGIEEADLGGDGAVDLAFVSLRNSEFRDSHRTFREDDEFLKLVYGAVRRVILRQKKQSRSVKRGGEGRPGAVRSRRQDPDAEEVRAANAGFRRIETDLDELVSGEAPIEDVVAAKLDFEILLERLPDQRHRAVLVLHDQGFTINEIASKLGIDRKTVARKLNTAKQLYRSSIPRS
jgi:DNA-directed RNA polymerase specialized sigma24 family protein